MDPGPSPGFRRRGGSYEGEAPINTILDVCSYRGAKHYMGGGHHWPPAGDGTAWTLLSSDLNVYVFCNFALSGFYAVGSKVARKVVKTAPEKRNFVLYILVAVTRGTKKQWIAPAFYKLKFFFINPSFFFINPSFFYKPKFFFINPSFFFINPSFFYKPKWEFFFENILEFLENQLSLFNTGIAPTSCVWTFAVC